ncbi:thioredoxin family protein [Planctomicrobium piriforme]|uniref:Thioredoxin 1 n=1 Tax=Planctomicrobium piriforme TaxID=1576369 RepID=A0A1I3BJS5_9PLAN|nr:thioredoxin family protein [Planctomicrobium piriforme]SFH62356.1 thioredoxin 1 [Planctomicrobium piriforme]
MAFEPDQTPPTRDELDKTTGTVVVQFGTGWCGYCNRFAPIFERLVKQYPDVQPIWVEDGPGRVLGRTFKVKLWPTLVFLKDGKVVTQLVRPTEAEAAAAFAEITS